MPDRIFLLGAISCTLIDTPYGARIFFKWPRKYFGNRSEIAIFEEREKVKLFWKESGEGRILTPCKSLIPLKKFEHRL